MTRSYLRVVAGDFNGFLGLVVDNLSVLALLLLSLQRVRQAGDAA